MRGQSRNISWKLVRKIKMRQLYKGAVNPLGLMNRERTGWTTVYAAAFYCWKQGKQVMILYQSLTETMLAYNGQQVEKRKETITVIFITVEIRQ
jgi:hypothetical protein